MDTDLKRLLDVAGKLIENSPDEYEDLPEMAETVAWAKTACRRVLGAANGLDPTYVWVVVMTAARLDKDFTVANIAWGLSDGGTAEAACPGCFRSLEIASNGQAAFPIDDRGKRLVAQFGPASAPHGTSTVDELPGWSARLEPFIALARSAGHPEIADVLATLCGRAQCPFCGERFHLGKALCIHD